MASTSDTPKLSSVLVTGGCGFIGNHLVAYLKEREPDCAVTVLDLHIDRNTHPNVTYLPCDISSKDSVARAFSSLRDPKPAVIFHMASPHAIASKDRPELYHQVSVVGTQNVLDAAKAMGSVRALVYTSSSSVVHDNISDLVNADESLPVLGKDKQTVPYTLAKAQGEALVLAANRSPHPEESGGGEGGGVMLTSAIRPATAFGEGDYNMLGRIVRLVEEGKVKFQMGQGTNLYDFTYVRNQAVAHRLLAQALLRIDPSTTPAPPPDAAPSADADTPEGQPFNITNNQPIPFWSFNLRVAQAMGRPVGDKELVKIPRKVGVAIAYAAEYGVWAASFGKRKSNFDVRSVSYTFIERTVSCKKAIRLLGYEPEVSMEEGIERGVKWFLDKEKEGKK